MLLTECDIRRGFGAHGSPVSEPDHQFFPLAKKRDEQVRAEFRAMMEADEMVAEEFVSSHEPLSTEAWDDMDLPF